eukprot:superscaffoldBa00003323_g16659
MSCVTKRFGQKFARAQQLILSLMMDTLEEAELCFPQLLNSSCRKPEPPHSESVLIYILLFFISMFTAALNLLVIISISHFRQK